MPPHETAASSVLDARPEGRGEGMNTVSSLPAGAELGEGPGGLSVLRLTTAGGSGEVILNGAHIVSWAPTGHLPVLWMSDEQPIRRR